MADYRTSHGSVPQAGGRPLYVGWSGSPWALAGLCCLNALLIVITLGIYWFWARSEYRRHMWRMVRIDGEPLEYTGTGRELLIGYLLLFAIVFLPAIIIVTVVQLAFGPTSAAAKAVSIALYIAFLFLYFVGVFRAHRYLLSRTRWRGIAFGVAGNASGYSWFSLWTVPVIGLTLGWIIPWRTTALRRRLTNAMYFGNVPFRFEGSSGPLYGPFVLLWFGLIIIYAVFAGAILGSTFLAQQALQSMEATNIPPDQRQLIIIGYVYGAVIISGFISVFIYSIMSGWYEARKLNTFANATWIGPLQGQLTSSAGSLIWLTLSNVFLLILTLGILRPVAQARRLRYLVENFSFAGSVHLEEILKGQEDKSLEGAGLEAAFSIDVF